MGNSQKRSKKSKGHEQNLLLYSSLQISVGLNIGGFSWATDKYTAARFGMKSFYTQRTHKKRRKQILETNSGSTRGHEGNKES
jgi:hypothetical protein